MKVKTSKVHPLRLTMINRLLNHIRDSKNGDNAALSKKDELTFKSFPYKEIVRPLVIIDKETKNLTIQQLSIKYQLSTMQIRWIIGL